MKFGTPIPHKKARIEIIPLIDIMFFLLASFMMVSLSQVHMKGRKEVLVPTGKSGETQSKKEYLSISVDADGNSYFDKTKVDYGQLTNMLREAHSSSPDAKVFVRGDVSTMHGNIIRVLDILRSVGYYKIAFEIKSEALKGVPGGT